MLKQITSLFVLFLFAASLMFAQGKPQVKKDVNPEILNPKEMQLSKPAPGSQTLQGEAILSTSYDYPANTSVGPMLYMYEGSPYVTAMQLLESNTDGNRWSMVAYKGALGWNSQPAFPEDVFSGWGSIQVAEDGPLAGNAIIIGHMGESYMSLFDVETQETTVDMENPVGGEDGGLFPRFVYLNDGTILATTDGLGAGTLHRSTDAGESWETLGIAAEDEYGGMIANGEWSELGVMGNPESGFVAIASPAVRAGNMFTDGAPEDSADIEMHYYSEDGGETWNAEIMRVVGKEGEVDNRPDYRTLSTNFDQAQFLVDKNNTTHYVLNGYSYNVGESDTAFTYPIYYWNSENDEFLAISDETVENYDSDAWDFFPGNGIGQAYPSVSTTDDGQVVFVAWQGPEFTGEVGNSDIAIYEGDGSDVSFEVFYTDIYYTYSTDGGQTWEDPQVLVGEAETAENYPFVANSLDYDPDSEEATAHFVYLYDELPGVSLFEENSASEGNQWLYDSYTFQAAVDVDEEKPVVTDYKLGQNYPNPFNPTTKIEFAIPQKQEVSVKVYDMLGKEVATVVDNEMTAGNHEVEFDASSLSSGMYLYTIKAGNFVETKKMMLLK